MQRSSEIVNQLKTSQEWNISNFYYQFLKYIRCYGPMVGEDKANLGGSPAIYFNQHLDV